MAVTLQVLYPISDGSQFEERLINAFGFAAVPV